MKTEKEIIKRIKQWKNLAIPYGKRHFPIIYDKAVTVIGELEWVLSKSDRKEAKR